MAADAPARALYVGVMSGTSLDGIDVALADLTTDVPRLIHARTHEIEPGLHADLVRLCAPGDDHVDLLGRTDSRFGAAIGRAVLALLEEADVPAAAIRAIGSHGQTIRHRPGARGASAQQGRSDDEDATFSLQIGDPNRIAELTGISVVADFRRRDMAAGGEGAPLVPAFHRAVFSSDRHRVVVNIGGMANVTLLPAGDAAAGVNAAVAGGFDTGPGNVLLDGWARRHLLSPMDRNGDWAAQGRVDPDLLHALLGDPWFGAPAPKSTGREHFDMHWLDARLDRSRAPAAVQATLTELTARSIAHGITGTAAMVPEEVLVCGGGRHNALLMERLQCALPAAKVMTTDAVGVDGDWVEALAFAWLAQCRLEQRPGNAPAATGARGPRILGAIYAGT